MAGAAARLPAPSSRRGGRVAQISLSFRDRGRFEYAGASGGFIDFLGYPFCRGRILRSVECDAGQYDDARDVFWVSRAAFCCRADVFRALGGFDADFFAHMEEIDLCWRMQLAGWRVRVVPESRVYHLGGGTLATDSPAKVFYNHRNDLAMLYKCASPWQRAVVAVVRPGLDLLAALSYLVQGRADSFRRCSAPGATSSAGTGSWPQAARDPGVPQGIGRREYLPRVGSSALSAGTPDLRPADVIARVRDAAALRRAGIVSGDGPAQGIRNGGDPFGSPPFRFFGSRWGYLLILAHESLSVTVRLKTRCSGVESVSGQK